jgi:hypothetical protein
MAKVMENERRAFSIAAFCEHYGIGRTSAYEEITAGRLQVVKAGKRTLVPADAAESWLRSLPAFEPKKAEGSDVVAPRPGALIAKKGAR